MFTFQPEYIVLLIFNLVVLRLCKRKTYSFFAGGGGKRQYTYFKCSMASYLICFSSHIILLAV